MVLITLIILGVIAAAIASAKGRSVIAWFFIGFFFGLLGVIIILCISNLKKEKAERAQTELENRRLREQVHQERVKAESFRQHAAKRLDIHDQHLAIDTRDALPALPVAREPDLLEGAAQPPDGVAGAAPYSVIGDGPGGQPSPPQSAVRHWRYVFEGEASDPISEPRLLAMLRSGELEASSLVWTEDLGDWKAVSDVKALKPFLDKS